MKNKSTKTTGNHGEELAAQFLLSRNYTILARNFRRARGEIDIIARKNGVLVFVEVKTARSRGFGAPQGWVDARKQRQIGDIAALYLQENEITETDCRFDVITVTAAGESWQINHIKNAFWL